MRYQQDNKLLDLLKGKRVAIVGPSPHLIGSGAGPSIDQYDLICRVNEVHPTGYELDYGNRTDIVFHNCGTRFINVFGQRLVEKSKISKHLRYVICPVAKSEGPDQWQTWPDDHISPVVDNFKKINIFYTPFHWIGLENYKLAYNLFGSEPNAGQVAIFMLLNYEVEELLITGFSFYAQGDHPSQSHRPGHTNKGLEDEMVGNPGHPQHPQLECFKNKIFETFKKQIRVDSYLDNLLSLNHQNVFNLE